MEVTEQPRWSSLLPCGLPFLLFSVLNFANVNTAVRSESIPRYGSKATSDWEPLSRNSESYVAQPAAMNETGTGLEGDRARRTAAVSRAAPG